MVLDKNFKLWIVFNELVVIIADNRCTNNVTANDIGRLATLIYKNFINAANYFVDRLTFSSFELIEDRQAPFLSTYSHAFV